MPPRKNKPKIPVRWNQLSDADVELYLNTFNLDYAKGLSTTSHLRVDAIESHFEQQIVQEPEIAVLEFITKIQPSQVKMEHVPDITHS
ncbi:hypothetical protein PCE1_002570 [Barthelona sp. PCE]